MRSRFFRVGVLARRARALVGHAVCAAAAVAVAITELSDDQRERPSHGFLGPAAAHRRRQATMR